MVVDGLFNCVYEVDMVFLFVGEWGVVMEFCETLIECES